MKAKLKTLIANYSFDMVERMYYNGQITQLTFEAYCRVWDWIAPRFGGVTGAKQEAYWKHRGKEAYKAKMNRVRVAFGYPTLNF